jgi:hypothetical protein
MILFKFIVDVRTIGSRTIMAKNGVIRTKITVVKNVGSMTCRQPRNGEARWV